ncbi:hypothetical protein J6590_061436 [Homalodisca vitripennis]|nr:hypothetical protein J6590_061436 [Homalodisca vitripennis]
MYEYVVRTVTVGIVHRLVAMSGFRQTTEEPQSTDQWRTGVFGEFGCVQSRPLQAGHGWFDDCLNLQCQVINRGVLAPAL